MLTSKFINVLFNEQLMTKKSSLFLLLLLPAIVLAAPSSIDKTLLQARVAEIVTDVNSGNTSSILNMFSPSAAPGLQAEVESSLAGRAVHLEQDISSYTEMSDGRVKVKGRFSASGIGWEVNGLSDYFTFEKIGDSWLLVDTDFHRKLSPSYVLDIIGKVLLVLIPVLLLLGAFWIWMLVDVIQREFENKVLWIVLIILLGVIGALLYFFIIRRVLKKQVLENHIESGRR
jgi:hypothetical protein